MKASEDMVNNEQAINADAILPPNKAPFEPAWTKL